MGRKQGTKGGKAKALDKGLKTLFRGVERQPVPKPIRDIVDQLDGASGGAGPGAPKKP